MESQFPNRYARACQIVHRRYRAVLDSVTNSLADPSDCDTVDDTTVDGVCGTNAILLQNLGLVYSALKRQSAWSSNVGSRFLECTEIVEGPEGIVAAINDWLRNNRTALPVQVACWNEDAHVRCVILFEEEE